MNIQEFIDLYNETVEEVNEYWVFVPERSVYVNMWAERAQEMPDFPYSKISDLSEVHMDIVSSNDDLKKMYLRLVEIGRYLTIKQKSKIL